jgi:molybdenum cofactor cytidylyltransferase
VLPVSAIVPAAGLSTRYGGPNKLLQPWKDSTIVGSVVSTLLACGLRVTVVTGRDAELVSRCVSPAQTVFNPDFASGLGSSIATGVREAPAGNGLLIALGDMPELSADTVRILIERYTTGDLILAPVYESEPDRPGHPVLFGADYRSELENLTGDQGARDVLRAHKENLVLLPLMGGLLDIDTP